MVTLRYKIIVSLLSCLLLLQIDALAAPTIPGIISPGQIEKQFQQQPAIRKQPAEKILPPLRRQQAPQFADQIKFVLTDVQLEGFSVFSSEELSDSFQSFLNREILLSDVYRLANDLTVKYRSAGYFLSQVFVPEQKIENGVVRLFAVEGFINEVIIDMAINDWRGLLDSFADKIKNTRPLTSAALERYMLLINDLPGISAKAVLSRSPNTFGAADLLIVAKQEHLSASVRVDNLGGKSLGPERKTGSIKLDNLLGVFDSTSLQFVESGNGEMSYSSITHEQQLGSEGIKLVLNANKTNSDPEELAFIPLDLESDSFTANMDVSWPAIRSRSQNLYITGGLKYYDGRTTLLGAPFSDEQIRSVKLGISWDFIDSTGATNLFDVQLHQGIDGLGSSGNGDNSLSIVNGQVDFTKMNLFAARLQPLAQDVSFLAALNAQLTDDTLLSPEQFNFGGESFGRGYDPSEKVADNGVALKLELRYRESSVFSIYGFYDVGWLWNTRELPGDYNEHTDSAGLGGSFRLGRYLTTSFEIAKPMNEIVSAEGNNDTRSYFGVTASF